jgi:hypothetical protein
MYIWTRMYLENLMYNLIANLLKHASQKIYGFENYNNYKIIILEFQDQVFFLNTILVQSA